MIKELKRIFLKCKESRLEYDFTPRGFIYIAYYHPLFKSVNRSETISH